MENVEWKIGAVKNYIIYVSVNGFTENKVRLIREGDSQGSKWDERG